MNKPDRVALIRSRFTAKYSMRRWIASPLKKRKQPRPEPLIRRCDHLGVANTRMEGTYEWIMAPDPRPKIELHLIRADDEPSTLTLIAKKMYEWNRMTWEERPLVPKKEKPNDIIYTGHLNPLIGLQTICRANHPF